MELSAPYNNTRLKNLPKGNSHNSKATNITVAGCWKWPSAIVCHGAQVTYRHISKKPQFKTKWFLALEVMFDYLVTKILEMQTK